MSFYIRAFLRGGALVAVHASDQPIGQDALTEGVDGVVDAEVAGDYVDSAVLYPLMSVVAGEVLIEGVPVPGQQAAARALVTQSLTEWRAGASLSKAAFLKALVGAGILSATDAVAAARGEVPPGFAAIIDAMPEADQVAAQIEWGAVANVTRLNPFINAVAAAAGVSAATLDQIFGWAG